MWLTNNARFCRSQDFVVIWNNLSEWAGTADSSEIRAKVIHGYKDALEREKKKKMEIKIDALEFELYVKKAERNQLSLEIFTNRKLDLYA